MHTPMRSVLSLWWTDDEVRFLLAVFYVHYVDCWRRLFLGLSWTPLAVGENAPAPQLKDNPSISIIIPCFNEEKNVEETIHAALAQRYENIEVIAVNDGSTDKTRAILDRMAAQIPHLRVIHLAQNQGKPLRLKPELPRRKVNIWCALMAMRY